VIIYKKQLTLKYESITKIAGPHLKMKEGDNCQLAPQRRKRKKKKTTFGKWDGDHKMLLGEIGLEMPILQPNQVPS
jgi:hypothetical protein